MNKNTKKIIFDTDLGDDIDDAFALYYGVVHTDLDIIGITTVYENSYLRARMAKKLIELIGVDLPVYAGYGKPIKGANFCSEDRLFCQYTEDLMLDKYKPNNQKENGFQEEAVDYIIESAKMYKEDLILVCVAPLTNIAMAIKKDPEAMRLIDRIVCMGGSFYDEKVEWNIVCDVDAAKTVFESGIKIDAFGLDVTELSTLKDKNLQRLLNKRGEGAYGYLLDITRLWYESYQRPIILYDHLTLYYLKNPAIFKMEEHPIVVDNNGEVQLGQTINLDINKGLTSNSKHMINCAKEVKIEKFFDEIIPLMVNN